MSFRLVLVLLSVALACGDDDAAGPADGGSSEDSRVAHALPDPLDLPPPRAGACAFVPPPSAAARVDNADCPDGVFHGDVKLRGPEDIARLRGCTRLVGSLTLELDATETLEGLESLRVITGALIKPPLLCTDGYCSGYNLHVHSLRGLDNLRCIGGDLSLIQPDDRYCKPLDLSALRRLVEVAGSLTLELCSGTEEQSLPSLQRVWGDMDYDVKLAPARLESVYGKLEARGATGKFASELYIGCGTDSTPCRDGVLGCSYVAENQAEVEALGMCEIALRDLDLAGTSITSLSALAQLREVRGTLTIGRAGHVPAGTEYGQLSSLSGLEPLAKVGRLTIGRLPSITSLAALSNLGAARSLRLDDLDGLQDLTGLTGIAQLAGDQPGDGELWIGGHAALRALTGLSLSSGVRELRVLDCPLLEGLGALSVLHGRLERLELDGLPALSNLDGLQQLDAIGALDIERCDSLHDLRELSLSSIQLIALAHLPSLRTLQDFLLPDVSELEELQLSGLPSLENLAGLERVHKVQGLSILECNGLSDLSGLGELRIEGLMTLASNPGLQNLHGLENLRTLTASITDNAMLEEVRALGGLTEGQLTITGNPKLTQCEVDWLIEHTRATVTESDNGPACPL